MLCGWLTLFVGVASAVEADASGESSRSLILSSNLAAEVVKSPVAEGDMVKKGALLLQLESGVARARLAQAEAELAYQKLLLAEAKNELQRNEELYDRTLLSDHDLDLARIAHSAAQSSFSRARAGLTAAQRELALRRIVAPFDAQVLELFVRAGETINGKFNSVKLIALQPVKKRR
jgi:multidrug efflux system membrane fusion protein